MQKQLYATALAIDYETGLDNEANEIYRKMVKKMRRAALSGEFEISWPKPVGQPNLVKRLERLMERDELHFYASWIISWKRAEAGVLPRLTSRELVQMGYNPGDGDLFKRILDQLRQAIADGRVSSQTLDGQIKWVKQAFPQSP